MNDYPHPDPAWDYAEVYDQVTVIQSDISSFITWLSENEEADSNIDKQAKTKLDDLINLLTELRDLF